MVSGQSTREEDARPVEAILVTTVAMVCLLTSISKNQSSIAMDPGYTSKFELDHGGTPS